MARFLADRPAAGKARPKGVPRAWPRCCGGEAELGPATPRWPIWKRPTQTPQDTGRSWEVDVEFLRARREKDNGLAVKDPEIPEFIEDIWGSAAQLATVGIFVLLFGAFLYVCRPRPDAGAGRDGGRHDARADRESRSASPNLALGDRGPSRHPARRRGRNRGDASRATRQRVDRQGAGDRREHQAEALRARPPVERFA